MTICNVARGPVDVTDGLLRCNETVAPLPAHSRIVIFGHTTDYGVTVTNSTVSLELSSVNITSDEPFLSIGSSVDILFSGTSELISSSANATAVDCSSLSNLTFSGTPGGLLIVAGGSSSTGIGAGNGSSCGSLTFLNGSYLVTGSSGIGAGPGPSSVASIAILGGHVTATGTLGAAIGSGRSDSSGNSTVGALLIGSAVVTAANSLVGAAIGAGSCVSGASSVGALSVVAGTVTANASLGAAVGSGFAQNGSSDVEELTISGGNIVAASHSGAAVGAGAAAYGRSFVSRLTTGGGNISAESIEGAGIGTGVGEWGNSSVEAVALAGGNITARSADGAAVGTGGGLSVVDRITVAGVLALVADSGRSYAIRAESIAMRSVRMVAETNASRLFECGPSLNNAVDLSILYSTPSAADEEPVGMAALSIGLLKLPLFDVWRLTLESTTNNWNKSMIIDPARIKRLFLSVEQPGDHRVLAVSGYGRGFLAGPDGSTTFSIGSAPAFLPEIHFVAATSSPQPTLTASGGIRHVAIIVLCVSANVILIVIVVAIVVFIVIPNRKKQQRAMATITDTLLLTDVSKRYT
jgi:hypothetical protein